MRLLIVEDDPRAAKALERSFGEHGFGVELALDGELGLSLAATGEFDCLVLDVMLPKMDGFTVLTELRAAGILTPVIFLTARDALPDRIRGLELGGGDYLVKPFAFSELLLRVHNLLGRGSEAAPRNWVIGDLTVMPSQRKIFRAGTALVLSAQEYALLEILARNAGHTVTRTRIAEELWDMAFDGDPNLVDAAVRRLRRKVDDPFPDKLIRTQRGVGYILEVPCV
ncbi:MAG: response regulator [Holophagaceae bacterium]|nr:response regulator [Holophagaceae bacterium]